MSGIALIWAANVKGLKPAAKIVLIQLADFHNKETGQCNPSAQRLADECEMDRATVFRHLTTLEQTGLLTRHAKGDGKGGRGSNQYELHLDVTLGPSAKAGVKSHIATGGKVANCDGGGRSIATGVVANCDTNLTIEPLKEPVCSADAAQHTHPAFDEFWKAYPRPKDRDGTERAFAQAVVDGADPAAIIAGAKAYAAENDGNGPMYLKHSANWLKAQGWQDHAPVGSLQRNGASADAIKANYARAIANGHASVARHCPVPIALELIAAGDVTPEKCRDVGLSV